MPDSFSDDAVTLVRPVGVNLTRRLGLEWIKGTRDGWFDETAAGLLQGPWTTS